MAQPLTRINCPNCKNPIQVSINQLIDVGYDPEAKSRLLSGGHNHIVCNICSYQGQIATPIVYHDPDKELLLTYVPVEMGIAKNEQERLLGRLINQALERLPAEKRKGYLLQPQAVLTMQGMIERILEADGISKEDLEAQRSKLLLFEELLHTAEDEIQKFAQANAAELDEAFFQLASFSLQATADENARADANQRLQLLLPETTFGKEIIARDTEARLAAESLQQLGDEGTREKLLDILLEAPTDLRVDALVQLTRPALDYVFFQKLTEKINQASDDVKTKLTALRQRILELTQEIDKAQEARAAEASQLIRVLLQSDDLDQAIKAALPRVDELFLSLLHSNIQAADKGNDSEMAQKLRLIDDRLKQIISEALPPGLQLAQRILEITDLEEAQTLLDESADLVDEQLLGALLSTTQRLEQAGDAEGSQRMRELHRMALKVSMGNKMQAT